MLGVSNPCLMWQLTNLPSLPVLVHVTCNSISFPSPLLVCTHHSISHPPVTPHSPPITPLSSLPTPHSSLPPITPHPSLLTHHSPLLTSRPSLSTTLQKREKRPREGLLTNELKYSVKYLNQFLPPEHNMRYIHIDMARINKR